MIKKPAVRFGLAMQQGVFRQWEPRRLCGVKVLPVRENRSVSVCMWLAVAVLCSVNLSPLYGQPPGARGPQRLASPKAIVGEPFGVLMAEFPIPPNMGAGGGAAGPSAPRVLVEDAENRVFYPVVTIRTVEVTEPSGPPPSLGIGRRGGLIDRVRSAIQGPAKKTQVPVAITVMALFKGTDTIKLAIAGDINQEIRIDPNGRNSAELQQLTRAWWSEYTAEARRAIAGDDFPKLVHKYLTTMLADRLSLPRVDLDPPPEKTKSDDGELQQPLETLALLAAIEPLREQILEEVIQFPGNLAGTEQTVPPEPLWQQPVLPPLQGEVSIEPSATRVPPECFYLRFGSFANYIWFQDLSARYGGDISQAVLLRGFNYEASKRMERMLAARLTTIAKMFGDKLVRDMSLIGTDLYLREGASLGVLFHASNPGLLNSSMQSDRKAALAKNPDASLETIQLAGRDVSLLSTPDNRIRSFLVSDGDFVLMTSSRTLAQRFIEVGAGGVSLANTPSFQWARTWMPEANNYSVFAYFSPEFFHRLVSPQYQIELRRRLEAVAHLEIATVATQTAMAEGAEYDSIEALQAGGYLPNWFDVRPDGARVLKAPRGGVGAANSSGNSRGLQTTSMADFQWIDSRRGARGSFIPIADMQLDAVTEAEAAEYSRIAGFYQEKWKTMDPLLLGLRRFQADGTPSKNGAQEEQVAIEAYIAPFDASKYGWVARQLAEPTPIELQLPADDAASVQLHVRGDGMLNAQYGNYHLFGGLKDMMPPQPEETKGLFKTLQTLQATPAYIGAWPKPALLDQLPLGIGASLARPDYAGFSRMLGGLWRWQDQEFSLLSFDRGILNNAIPQLGVAESSDLAQARVRVANLSGTQIADWINQQWYQRGWKASQGNARFLDALHQQLKVPGDQCFDVAEQMLDVNLQCPLGGEYRFEMLPSGKTGWWRSSAWGSAIYAADGSLLPPPDYQAPWIDWFRGAKLHVTQQPDSLAVVGDIRLEMQPYSAPATESEPSVLPPMNFDVFQLPMQLFGGAKAEKEEAPKRRAF